MINWDRVKELRREIGTEAFEEVIELFLDEVETGLAELRDDMSAVERAALLHFLKGSALNLGFAVFAELCETAEWGRQYLRAAEITDCYDRSRAEFLANIGTTTAA